MPRLRSRLAELSALANDQDWSDHKSCSSVLKEKSCLEDVLGKIGKIESDLDFLSELESIGGDPGMEQELERVCRDVDKFVDSDPGDQLDAFMTIRAGSGGKEAQDWAQMLLRMYCKWASRCGLEVEMMDIVYADIGIRSVVLRINGPGAYGRMKTERGIHRLSRVSPYDQADRRQTSFSSIEVIPHHAKSDLFVDPKDLDVYYCCGSGPGGQAINKTEVVAVVKHLPTGIIVRSQATRSQQKNKEVAIGILRSRLVEMQREEERSEKDARRKLARKPSFGGEARRTYVLSQHPAIHDHHTEKTGRVKDVMDGDLSSLY